MSAATQYFAVDVLPAPSEVARLVQAWQGTAQRLPGAELFALIDTAFDEAACRTFLQDRPTGRAVSLYGGTEFEVLAPVSPWLVRLHTDAPPQINQEMQTLLRLRGGRPMLSFIAWAHGIEALQQHFRPFLQTQLPDGTSMFLRFADTRILGSLFGALTVEQRAALWPGNMAFWFPRRKAGQYGMLAPDPQRQAPRIGQLKLDEAQLAALLNDCEPDLVIQRLATTQPELLPPWPPHQVHAFIEQQVSRAREHGLQDTPDIVQYCQLALTLSPTFDRHPEFEYALRPMNQPGQFLLRLAEVPERAWQEVAAQSTRRAA